MLHRYHLSGVTALVALLSSAAPASAQTTITSPSASQKIKSGADFATDVIGNPWDMTDRSDYSLDPDDVGYFQSDFGIGADGTLGGTTLASGNVDPSVFVFYRSRYGVVNPLNLISGGRFPIDAAKYTRIAFKLRSSANGSVPNVRWFHTPWGDPLGDQTGLKFPTAGGANQETVANTWTIYTIDLPGTPFNPSEVHWETGSVAGLRLGVNLGGNGQTLRWDWVRLTNSNDILPITWTSSQNNGTWSIEVTEGTSTQFNSDGSKYTVATGLSGSTRLFNFPYGILPPGSYSLRVFSTFGDSATQTFVINDPPRVQLTSPDMTGGSDFATAVLNNPWDMNDSADVQSTFDIGSISFNGALNGTTGASGDSRVTFFYNSNPGNSTVINTSTYHRLTYCLQIDRSYSLGGGSVARVFWGSSIDGSLSTTSKDVPVFNGMNCYTVDLSTLTTGNFGLEPNSNPQLAELWTAANKRLFRIDPHEFPEAVGIHFNDVKIAADATSTGNYTVAYDYVSTDDSATLNLYYDTDTNTTNGKGTLFSTINLAATAAGSPFAASKTLAWGTTSIPSGTYYVYAEVSDAFDTRGWYSTGPIAIVSPAAPPPDADSDGLSDAFETQYGLDANSGSGNNGAGGDPDGDGFTNLQEYERGSNPTRTQVWPHVLDLNGDRGGDGFLYNLSTGAWRFELTNRLTTGFTERPSAWDPGWQVYPANLNADEYTDFFLYDPVRGFWIQALNVSGGGTFTYTLGNWDRSWTVVPADLDGDGVTDMFVYNFATGVWVKCFVNGRGDFKGYTVGNWDPGWTFFTADLNGDGRDDFFLYNRVNGVWVEAFSQGGFGAFDYPASSRWDPGWQVYPTDLNGDGRTDLFLLNAAGVHVSALSRATGDFDYGGIGTWSPGWTVSPGDLNADGRADLFLYNSTSGVWVEAFSDAAGDFTYSVGQWDPGWSVRMTDLNEDGRGDLLLDRADGTWVQATNTGTATFTYAAGNWGTGWTLFTRRSSDR